MRQPGYMRMQTIAADVLMLMLDGRERTADDVAARMKITRDDAREALRKLHAHGEVSSGEAAGVRTWIRKRAK